MSEKELRSGIRIIQKTGAPSPSKHAEQGEAGGSGLAPSSDALAKWAQDMKSGISPIKRNLSGPSTPRSNRILSDTSSPITPSRSGLRDRSSIKEKRVFDPSPLTTPTKSRKLSATSTPSGSTLKKSNPFQNTTPQKEQSKDIHQASQSSINANIITNKPITPSKRTQIATLSRPKHREPIYPVSFGFDVIGKDEERWSEEKALKRIQRCIDALEKMKKEGKTEPWKTTKPGEYESIRIEF